VATQDAGPGQLAHAAPAQWVQPPVRVVQVGRLVQPGDLDRQRRLGQPVGESDPGARLQVQCPGGCALQCHLHGCLRVTRPGVRQASRDQSDTAAVERGEVRQAGLAALCGGCPEAAGQRVRPRSLQLPYGHREPVEGGAGRPAHQGVGLLALFAVHIGGDEERGLLGGAVGERVPQGRVAHGAGERGERGQHTGGEQHGQDGGGEQEPMRAHPHEDEARHLIPRTLSSPTPPGAHRMLSEDKGFWIPLGGAP
jgi:hypothetical protein